MLTKNSRIFTNLPELLNQFYEPLSLDLGAGFNSTMAHWSPKIDVKDEASRYVIHADLPGVEIKDIDIRMENGCLTIKGHKESKKKEERENYVCVERSEGTFCRSMSLPSSVDTNKIDAKIKNGVLEVIIPKAKEGVSQKINIKQG